MYIKINVLKKSNPTVYQAILDYTQSLDVSKFSQRQWHYQQNTLIIPTCKVCDKPTTYINYTKGYHTYCSTKCMAKDKAMKRKETCLKKYGVENPSQVKQFNDKRNDTFKKNYGCHPLADKGVREKGKVTLQQTIGVDNYFKRSDLVQQAVQKKYGVNYISQLPEFQAKVRETHLKKYFTEQLPVICTAYNISPLFSLETYKGQGAFYKFSCQTCGNEFDVRLDDGKAWYRCSICLPYSRSKFEKEIADYIQSIYMGKTFITNAPNVIKDDEHDYSLDIYLVDEKIAIECNGLHWHSTEHRDKNYHLTKTTLCEKNGIRLIHIFDDEWLYKQDIVKSRLRHILGINTQTIYARNCTITHISKELKQGFLNATHIQGNDKSTIFLGAYHNHKLVAVMTFSKPRIALGNKSKIELSRFAVKYNVVGIGSKLFTYFLKTQSYSTIITYADRRWSQGGIYKKLGFTHTHNSPPNYWYVVNNKRMHRFAYRKSRLVNDGYSPDLTEDKIMEHRGIHRVYDCGTMVFEYNRT